MPSYYIIFILLCILSIIFLKNYFMKNQINALQTYNLQKAYNFAEQGDLILFQWYKINPLQESVSPFTHVGIVIDINKKKYILETHLKGDTKHMGYKDAEGVNIYDFKKRIKMYKGKNYLLKKNPMYKMDIMQKLTEYINIPFYKEYKQHFVGYCIPKKICNSCLSDKIMNSMFCSQFIGYILQEQGVLDKSTNIDCLTPMDFLSLTNSHGRIYTKLIKISK